MTIAAGFECNDGIVLATDLEITENMIKRTGGKSSFKCSNGTAIAIAGAGYYDVLAYACEKLRETSIDNRSFSEILEDIRNGLRQLYADHICLSFAETEWDKALQLIVDVVDKGDEVAFHSGLYTSARSILHSSPMFTFVGYGADLASYIVQKKWKFAERSSLNPMRPLEQFTLPSLDEAVPLALDLILEVGANSPYCGRGAVALAINSDGQASYVHS